MCVFGKFKNLKSHNTARYICFVYMHTGEGGARRRREPGVGVHRSRGDARELAARARRPAWWGKLFYSGMSGNRREKGAARADWEEGKIWEKGTERAGRRKKEWEQGRLT
jgi:hypothetical protein